MQRACAGCRSAYPQVVQVQLPVPPGQRGQRPCGRVALRAAQAARGAAQALGAAGAARLGDGDGLGRPVQLQQAPGIGRDEAVGVDKVAVRVLGMDLLRKAAVALPLHLRVLQTHHSSAVILTPSPREPYVYTMACILLPTPALEPWPARHHIECDVLSSSSAQQGLQVLL